MIANKHERPKRRENQRPAREVLSLEKIAGQEIARPCYRPVYQGRAVRLHGVSAHSRGCRASFLGRDGRHGSAQAGERIRGRPPTFGSRSRFVLGAIRPQLPHMARCQRVKLRKGQGRRFTAQAPAGPPRGDTGQRINQFDNARPGHGCASCAPCGSIVTARRGTSRTSPARQPRRGISSKSRTR